jgi:hypothetical protein
MSRLYPLAKFLVCCWRLGGEENEPIPSFHGILDRALELARERQALPPWVWEGLHFSDTRVGLQCLELPGILDWAQTAELAAFVSPAFQALAVKIDAPTARRLLEDMGVSAEEAAGWGRALREAARQATAELAMPP